MLEPAQRWCLFLISLPSALFANAVEQLNTHFISKATFGFLMEPLNLLTAKNTMSTKMYDNVLHNTIDRRLLIL